MTLRPIGDVARDLGLADSEWEPRGRSLAKIAHSVSAKSARGRIVLVTSMTPTKRGEGKTLTTIGLTQALRLAGERAVAVLRQPSLGPLFGTKGGATGSGRSEALPSEAINLHATGDFHAVAAAQNLVAAMLDSHVHHGNALGVDPRRVLLPRCVDVNDRQLRRVVTGLGGDGVPREEGFVITAASEAMAVLSLAESWADLRARLGRMVVALDRVGAPVTADDLRAGGAAAALLRDALLPNLAQTTEGAPAIVHGGPFANVSHGTASVMAARAAQATADVAVIEAGFGADLGAEKFVDVAGLRPSAAVVVATARAVAEHGLANLEHHVAFVRKLGIPPVVAVNRFPADSQSEIDAILARCAKIGAPAAAHACHDHGGAGGAALAGLILDALAKGEASPRPLYARSAPFVEKLRAIAREAYGADDVALAPAAVAALERARRAGLDGLPVCVAKTPLSLTDDASVKGAPRGWTLHVRDVEIRAGAGYLVALAGDLLLMPGLGREPAAFGVELAADGTITGLR